MTQLTGIMVALAGTTSNYDMFQERDPREELKEHIQSIKESQEILRGAKMLIADVSRHNDEELCKDMYDILEDTSVKVELKDTVLELALKLKKHLESSIKLEGMLIGFCKEDIKKLEVREND